MTGTYRKRADHTLLVDIHALQQENRSKISTESWSY